MCPHSSPFSFPTYLHCCKRHPSLWHHKVRSTILHGIWLSETTSEGDAHVQSLPRHTNACVHVLGLRRGTPCISVSAEELHWLPLHGEHTHKTHIRTHTRTYICTQCRRQEGGKGQYHAWMNIACWTILLNAGPKKYTVPSHHAGVRLHSTVTRVSVNLWWTTFCPLIWNLNMDTSHTAHTWIWLTTQRRHLSTDLPQTICTHICREFCQYSQFTFTYNDYIVDWGAPKWDPWIAPLLHFQLVQTCT